MGGCIFKKNQTSRNQTPIKILKNWLKLNNTTSEGGT